MFLCARRHTGNSRPGTDSVVRCEWRFSVQSQKGKSVWSL
ncbi:hypothetical protein HMPREF1602_04447 [Escherichia coli 907889]|nr:hypothetical protein HMPREF1602_04447 [Escherichia coli 907889]